MHPRAAPRATSQTEPVYDDGDQRNDFQPQPPRDPSGSHQSSLVRAARLRTLGAKIVQMDALLSQYDAETSLLKWQMRSVIAAARRDVSLLGDEGWVRI